MALTLSVLGPFLGGLGLFLLGMGMMTDGLKLAAGAALQRVLGWATRTRGHALASGFLVTTAMQSSSAVTVAAIGFINAGLLGLAPALWVLFGSNVGSTTTAWIVALVGLKFKIEAFALPMVGLGMLLRLTGSGERRGHVGSAVAGFGLLFLGIAMLQQAFGSLTGLVDIPQGRGLGGLLAQLGVGVLMTVLMQSSAASMAVALTAAQGGLIDTPGAAAVVIGANIGTTFTAILAAIGATPNARRAASAHVVFNLVTAAVALMLLPWLLDVIAMGRQALDLPPDPATKLALFHTCFNLLGVLLMWPLAAPLTRWLLQRFRAHEEDEAQPRHLDDNVLAVPALAVQALQREIARIGVVALRMVRAALGGAAPAALAADRTVVAQLDAAAEAFVERVNRNAMPQGSSEDLARALRVLRYHETAAEQALAAAALRALPAELSAGLSEAQRHFRAAAGALLARCEQGLLPVDSGVWPDAQGADAGGQRAQAAQVADGPAANIADKGADKNADAAAVTEALMGLEANYQALKGALLSAGAAGQVALAPMEEALRHHSALRRAAQQAAKAVLALQPATDPGATAFSDDTR